MDYFISFLEGILAFISPCILPMVPIYVSYLIGKKEKDKPILVYKSVAFVLGFTIVFVLMGALASTFGIFMSRHQREIQVIFGIIMILFGLHYMELLPIKFLQKERRMQMKKPFDGILSSVLFGIFFAIGWTPCVGVFLGAALMLAASQTEMLKGVMLLLCFSLGLAIPFLLCSFLLSQLDRAFAWIKKHYQMINRLAGIILILIGILMITGYFSKIVNYFIGG